MRQRCWWAVVGLVWSSIVQADARTCLNNAELAALVVLEIDIQQSVMAHACRTADPKQESIYQQYEKLRQSWQGWRAVQRARRDQVYQRIYGQQWQDKVASWEWATALHQADHFDPSPSNCQQLRTQMQAHQKSWKTIYQDAAHQVMQADYGALRCKPLSQGR